MHETRRVREISLRVSKLAHSCLVLPAENWEGLCCLSVEANGTFHVCVKWFGYVEEPWWAFNLF